MAVPSWQPHHPKNAAGMAWGAAAALAMALLGAHMDPAWGQADASPTWLDTVFRSVPAGGGYHTTITPEMLIEDPDDDYLIVTWSTDPPMVTDLVTSSGGSNARTSITLDGPMEDYDITVFLSPDDTAGMTLDSFDDDISRTFLVDWDEPPVFVTGEDLGTAYTDTAVRVRIHAEDPDPYDADSAIRFSLYGTSTLPDGLQMNNGGLITGTPTTGVEDAEFEVEIYTVDADRSLVARKNFTMTVLDESVSLSTYLPVAVEGQPYYAELDCDTGSRPVHHFTVSSDGFENFFNIRNLHDVDCSDPERAFPLQLIADSRRWPGGIYPDPGLGEYAVNASAVMGLGWYEINAVPLNVMPNFEDSRTVSINITAYSDAAESDTTRIYTWERHIHVRNTDLPHTILDPGYSLTEHQQADDPRTILVEVGDLIEDGDDDYVITFVLHDENIRSRTANANGTYSVKLKPDAADFGMAVRLSHAETMGDPSDDFVPVYPVTITPTPDLPRFGADGDLGSFGAGFEDLRIPLYAYDPDEDDESTAQDCTVSEGSLPDGLTIGSGSCYITGEATSEGDATFTVDVYTAGRDPAEHRSREFTMSTSDDFWVPVQSSYDGNRQEKPTDMVLVEGSPFTETIRLVQGSTVPHHVSIDAPDLPFLTVGDLTRHDTLHPVDMHEYRTTISIDHTLFPGGIYSATPGGGGSDVVPYNLRQSDEAIPNRYPIIIRAYSAQEEGPDTLIGTGHFAATVQNVGVAEVFYDRTYVAREGGTVDISPADLVWDPDNDFIITGVDAPDGAVLSGFQTGSGYRLALDADNDDMFGIDVRLSPRHTPGRASDDTVVAAQVGVIGLPDSPRFETPEHLGVVDGRHPWEPLQLEARDPDAGDEGKQVVFEGILGGPGATIAEYLELSDSGLIEGQLVAGNIISFISAHVEGSPAEPAYRTLFSIGPESTDVAPTVSAHPGTAVEGQPYTIDMVYDDGSYDSPTYVLVPGTNADFFALDAQGDVVVDRTAWPEGIYSLPGGTPSDVIPYNAVPGSLPNATASFSIYGYNGTQSAENRVARHNFEVTLEQTDLPPLRLDPGYAVSEPADGEPPASLTVDIADLLSDPDSGYLLLAIGSSPAIESATPNPDGTHTVVVQRNHDTDFELEVTISPASTPADTSDDSVHAYGVDVEALADRARMAAPNDLGTVYVGHAVEIDLEPYDEDTADAGKPFGCTVSSGALPDGLSIDACVITGTPTERHDATFGVGVATTGGSPANPRLKTFEVFVSDLEPVTMTSHKHVATETHATYLPDTALTQLDLPWNVTITTDNAVAYEGHPFAVDMRYVDGAGMPHAGVHHYRLHANPHTPFLAIDDAGDISASRAAWGGGNYTWPGLNPGDIVPFNVIPPGASSLNTTYTVSAYSAAAENRMTILGRETFDLELRRLDVPYLRLNSTWSMVEGQSFVMYANHTISPTIWDRSIYENPLYNYDSHPWLGLSTYWAPRIYDEDGLYGLYAVNYRPAGEWTQLDADNDESFCLDMLLRSETAGVRHVPLRHCIGVVPVEDPPKFLGEAHLGTYPADRAITPIWIEAADPDADDSERSLVYSLGAGSLPDGLSLNSSGFVTGTPRAHQPADVGNHTFVVRVHSQGEGSHRSALEHTINIINTGAPRISASPEDMVEGQPYSVDVSYAGNTGAVHHYNITHSGSLGFLALDGSGDVEIDRTKWPDGIYSMIGSADSDVVPYNVVRGGDMAAAAEFTISAYSAAEETPQNRIASRTFEVQVAQTDYPDILLDPEYDIVEGREFFMLVPDLIRDPDWDWVPSGGAEADPKAAVDYARPLQVTVPEIMESPDGCVVDAGNGDLVGEDEVLLTCSEGYLVGLERDHEGPLEMCLPFSPEQTPDDPSDDIEVCRDVTISTRNDAPRFPGPGHLGTHFVGYPLDPLPLRTYDPDSADAGRPIIHALASGALPGGILLTESGTLAGTPTEAVQAEFRVRASTDGGPPNRARTFTMWVEDRAPAFIDADPGIMVEGSHYFLDVRYFDGDDPVDRYELTTESASLQFLALDANGDVVVDPSLWPEGSYGLPGQGPGAIVPYNAVPQHLNSTVGRFTISAYSTPDGQPEVFAGARTFAVEVQQRDPDYVQLGPGYVVPEGGMFTALAQDLIFDVDTEYVITGEITSDTPGSIAGTAPAGAAGRTVTLTPDGDLDFAMTVTLSPDHTPGDPADDLVLVYNVDVVPSEDAPRFTSPADLGFYPVDAPLSVTLEAYDPDTDDTEETYIAFSLGTGQLLPPGLVLSEGGTISGTPTQADTYTFTVTAASFGRTPETDMEFTMRIIDSAPPEITASPNTAVEGQPYGLDVTYVDTGIPVRHVVLVSPDLPFLALNGTNDVVASMDAWEDGIYHTRTTRATPADIVPYNAVTEGQSRTGTITLHAYSQESEFPGYLLGSKSFTVTVMQTDVAPGTYPEPLEIDEDSHLGLTKGDLLYDPDGDYFLLGLDVPPQAAFSTITRLEGGENYTITMVPDRDTDFAISSTWRLLSAAPGSADLTGPHSVLVNPSEDPPVITTDSVLRTAVARTDYRTVLEAYDPDTDDAGLPITFAYDASPALDDALALLPNGTLSGVFQFHGNQSFVATATTGTDTRFPSEKEFLIEVLISPGRDPDADLFPPVPTDVEDPAGDETGFAPQCVRNGAVYELASAGLTGTGEQRRYEVIFKYVPEGVDEAWFVFEGGPETGVISIANGTSSLVDGYLTSYVGTDTLNAVPEGSGLRVLLIDDNSTISTIGVYSPDASGSPLYYYEDTLLNGAHVRTSLPDAAAGAVFYTSDDAHYVPGLPSGSTPDVELTGSVKCVRGTGSLGGSEVIDTMSPATPGNSCEFSAAPQVLEYGEITIGSVSAASPAHTVQNSGTFDISEFVVTSGDWLSSGELVIEGEVTEMRIGSGAYGTIPLSEDVGSLHIDSRANESVQFRVNMQGFKNQDIGTTGESVQEITYTAACG